MTAFLLGLLVSDTYNNIFVKVSVIGLVSVFILALYEFIIPRKKRWIPYIEESDMKKYAKQGDVEGFCKKFVYECFQTMGESNKALFHRINLIRKTTFILMISVYIPIAYEIYTNYTLFLSGSIILFVVILIVFHMAFKKAMKDLV